jgi:hypothetical protein
MASASTARKSLLYANDGTGRDTFVNYAGAYWMNPLPAGVFFKSTPDVIGNALQGSHGTVVIGDDSAFPGRTLFGKSRYGTTVLAADQAGLTQDGLAGSPDGSAAATDERQTPREGEGDFDGEGTALAHVPYDVSQPEQRLRQPGHATTGLEGTDGGSTYTGLKGEWTAPNAVDNTLLRLAPTYESTCHHHLRTGRFYTDDAAPAPLATLPDKGVTWGRSRYY